MASYTATINNLLHSTAPPSGWRFLLLTAAPSTRDTTNDEKRSDISRAGERSLQGQQQQQQKHREREGCGSIREQQREGPSSRQQAFNMRECECESENECRDSNKNNYQVAGKSLKGSDAY
ncbi:GL24495 [Drosophila persimilis]|uniref:GL24495 n=1 Tax=Drosophila persimilis TaxID=7234 RepID=B4G3Y1_DROPE|nr:GL24495 [Drosophila persimilis]